MSVPSLALLAILPLLLGIEAQAEDRIVCYFINWAWYRHGDGKFIPEDIDPTKCTHINYAFAVLDANTLTLKPSDSWADLDNHFYTKVTKTLKSQNPNVKVLISLGGWTDSAGDKYSRLVNDAGRRQNFIQQVIPFLKQHGFDGLDIDWEYPKCWQGDCRGPASDKTNYGVWLKELRAAFDKESPRLLLTAAVAAGERVTKEGYDVPAMAQALDFINIMTYDMHGSYAGGTSHHAPLTARPQDADQKNNVASSLKMWNEMGCPKNKLVMGVPIYGRSFRLTDPNNNGIGAPSSGPGDAGETTGEAGFLGFFEICIRLKSRGWTKQRDPNAGPYAYQGNQWVGYDDPEDATKKAQWVKANGYGGVMVWDMTMDDFSRKCCNVKYPFLTALNYGLKGQGTPPSSMGCP